MQIITDKTQKEKKEHGSFSFPFLLSYERLSAYESGSFLWHWHPEAELTLITSGKMEYHVNEQVFYAKEGDVIFCNGGALHAGNMTCSYDCSYNAITFLPKLIYGYKESVIYNQYVRPIVENPGFGGIYYDYTSTSGKKVHDLTLQISEVASNKKDGYELTIISLLTTLWKILWSDYEASNTRSHGDFRRNYERIRSIISYVENHYQEKITLDDVASCVHLSRSECSRIFKANMQQSLFGFIQQYRIQKSLDYLLDTDATITEIADMVGIPDPNYFAKTFTKIQGMSPSAYRKHRG
ncbi:MAG: AraC family transcriptional regulator [Lachnospiraceae bacterium]|jgi:AraC-like DNA-binding protein|nr:AraC family transcriptional regulator [Lachnospiraceae bacterium]